MQVRSRRWLVEEVVIPEAPGHSPVLRLACADDDAQGQSLDVLWNYEIDRLILEEEGWGDLATKGFDDPRQIRDYRPIIVAVQLKLGGYEVVNLLEELLQC